MTYNPNMPPVLYTLRFLDTVATNVDKSTFLVNSPERSQTSLSIYKRSHARICKKNNLTTIKMDTEAAHGPLKQFGLFLSGQSHTTLLVATAVQNWFFDFSNQKLPQSANQDKFCPNLMTWKWGSGVVRPEAFEIAERSLRPLKKIPLGPRV